ncbi:MAG: FtsX-like permease family protein, partial [bacterium]
VSFLEKFDYGIQSKNIVNVTLQDVNYDIFKREIETNPNIQKISASAFVPMTGVLWKGQCKLPNGSDSLDIDYICVDENFIDNLGLTILAGSNFINSNPAANQSSILINEKAARRFGYNNPIDAVGKSIEMEDAGLVRIIGIVKDFHYFNFEHEIEPLIISYVQKYFRYANIKVNPHDIQNTISFLESKWKSISPSTTFTYKIYDDELKDGFFGPRIIITVIGLISFLSILISSFGLFGMVIFDTESRVREIGIRKVLGASVSDITLTLSKSFLNLLLLSFTLALPLAWFFNNLFLSEMAIHSPLSIGLFIFALLGMLVIGAVIVLPKTIKAATTNPVESIKY